MNEAIETPNRTATRLIDGANDRLGGVLRILEMMHHDDRPAEPDAILILMDAIGDVIDRLQEHVLPLIDPAPDPQLVLPVRCVPRG